MKKASLLFFLIPIFFINHAKGQDFARGADIGWLSEMEASGRRFYNDEGQELDLLDILKEHCINSIRLRVWVDPANGWSGEDDVAYLAKRAADKGFRIMIDFHYSDNWADPGKQFKPAAWENYSVPQLTQAVYDHTYEVLNRLKSEGVTPEWVQIGNETSDGMLWPEGRASEGGMTNYAGFVTSGHQAAKAVFPDIITIAHVANGFDNGLFRWNIGGIINNGAQFDAIAMSLYPEPNNWQTLTQQCLSNMQDMVSRYNKPVVISEIGMSVSATTEAKAYVEDIIAKNMSLTNNMGLGVFWWEPQAYNWRGYDKVAWTNNGRPTIAMDGFQTNCQQSVVDCAGIENGEAYMDNCGECVGGTTGQTACQPVSVTFKVSMPPNMSAAYFTGTTTEQGGNWQILAMEQESDTIFRYSTEMYPGETGAYYYLNANEWGSRESVPQECATWYDSDRGYEIGENDTIIENFWASCDVGYDGEVITSIDGSSVGTQTKAGNAPVFYPNPFSEEINFSGKTNWELLNIHGELLNKGYSEKARLNHIQSGIYLIRVEEKVYRLIKE